MRRLTVVVIVGCFFGVAPAALGVPREYTLKHPKHQHCRAHYVRRVERRHHRRVVVCVHVAEKKVGVPLTTIVRPHHRYERLRIHLDPSFTQNPVDPLQVTYTYSAGAVVVPETAAATPGVVSEETTEPEPQPVVETPAPTVPEGVLELYSNGTLACAANVGGTLGSVARCTVTYSHTGPQTVTTTYISGTNSTTETETENIEPVATATHLTVIYEPEEHPVNVPWGVPHCVERNQFNLCVRYTTESNIWLLGRLNANATVDGPPGGAVNIQWPDAGGPAVYAEIENETILRIGLDEPLNSTEGLLLEFGVQQVESCELHATAHYGGGGGFLGSDASAAVCFTPGT